GNHPGQLRITQKNQDDSGKGEGDQIFHQLQIQEADRFGDGQNHHRDQGQQIKVAFFFADLLLEEIDIEQTDGHQEQGKDGQTEKHEHPVPAVIDQVQLPKDLDVFGGDNVAFFQDQAVFFDPDRRYFAPGLLLQLPDLRLIPGQVRKEHRRKQLLDHRLILGQNQKTVMAHKGT